MLARDLPQGVRRLVVLCADDYAMTDGISRAIEALAEERRLSAAAAMVTLPAWAQGARRLARLRASIATGLHLNLTLGAPLGPMPSLAPAGEFPRLGMIAARAVCGALEGPEVEAEIERQLQRFEDGTGYPPDFVDGHQHVHALPVIRHALIRVVLRRYPGRRPLVRDPRDRLVATVRRGRALAKTLTLAYLARGFGDALRRAGIETNDSFAGVTHFRPLATAADFSRVLLAPGGLHLVMCHPGLPDGELSARDPMSERRLAEFEYLKGENALQASLWRPRRAADGPPVDWAAERAAAAP